MERVISRAVGAEIRHVATAVFLRLLPLLLISFALAATALHADEPFAPTREYDLQNARIELRFDVDKRELFGQVTHTLAALHDGLRQLDFDSVGLEILSVRVNGADSKFNTDAAGLHVTLDHPTKTGGKYEVAIRYQGSPKKGLYFILPNASFPNQPKEIWTQGEAEDTRYYIPIYDYPNNRETTQMIVTVPKSWTTVSNGKLEGVTDAPNGEKTWTWRQSERISSYLISLVAGEFDSSTQTWRNIPVDYHVPHGMADRIEPTFSRTRAMLSFFSDRLGVPYPWVKYDQTTVDQFVEGGMENASATTLTVHGLQNPTLARESLEGSDNLISHEMSHQWFGDLVTTKDWANLWLNEGFATFMAQLWEEHQYGADNMSYSRFRQQGAWFRQSRLFGVPVVTRDFDDSMAYAGNIYGKAGIVLEMLREQLGDDAFFAGLHHYLDTNKYGNVVTADLVRALEESSHVNLDRFFEQWIYGAGAPRFAVTSSYDPADKMVRLNVKQTQQVRGRVGLFDVPIEVDITTAKGTHSYPIQVSKELETFSFPAESAPLMVLFDKGDKILKAVEFNKQPAEWIYQLQKAQDAADRASAAQAMGAIKGNQDVIAALGQAALDDRFWGVRNEAITALGRLGGTEAERGILAAIQNSQPWVREVAVTQIGHFHDDAVVSLQLKDLIRNDPAYRVRAAALAALAQMKAQGARDVLEAAVNTNSPDDVISRAALRSMGLLGDDKSVPTLVAKATQNNPVPLREAAIGSLGRLDKKNQTIESQVISYLQDPDFDVRTAAMVALAGRGDPAAIAPMEEQLHTNNPTLGDPDMVEAMINRLKRTTPSGDGERDGAGNGAGDDSPTSSGDSNSSTSTSTGASSGSATNSADSSAANADAGAAAARAVTAQVVSRLDQLEREIAEVNDRLKKIEQEMPAKTAAQ